MMRLKQTMANKQIRTRKNRKKRALTKPDVFKEFILWMSVFETFREPRTQQEFAKKFHVNDNTLTNWKQRDDFWEAVEVEWKKWGREKTINVMNKFYNQIMQQGESSNFRLWFQYFLDWQEKSRLQLESGDLKEFNESLRKILEKHYDEPTGDEGNKGSGEDVLQKQPGTAI